MESAQVSANERADGASFIYQSAKNRSSEWRRCGRFHKLFFDLISEMWQTVKQWMPLPRRETLVAERHELAHPSRPRILRPAASRSDVNRATQSRSDCVRRWRTAGQFFPCPCPSRRFPLWSPTTAARRPAGYFSRTETVTRRTVDTTTLRMTTWRHPPPQEIRRGPPSLVSAALNSPWRRFGHRTMSMSRSLCWLPLACGMPSPSRTLRLSWLSSQSPPWAWAARTEKSSISGGCPQPPRSLSAWSTPLRKFSIKNVWALFVHVFVRVFYNHTQYLCFL